MRRKNRVGPAESGTAQLDVGGKPLHARYSMRSENKTNARLALAVRLTAVGAQLSITAAVALLAAKVASQLIPQHSRLSFGTVGGTVALLMGRFLGRFFRAFG